MLSRPAFTALISLAVFTVGLLAAEEDSLSTRAKSLQNLLVEQQELRINKEKEFLASTLAQLKSRNRNRSRQQTRSLKAKTERLKQEIASLEQGLRELRSGRLRWPDLDSRYLKIGQAGMLDGGPAGFEVVQIISPTEMHIRRLGPDDDRLIKLRGIPTAELVSGKRNVHFDDAGLQVTGTETYTTVTGASNTVFVLEQANDKLLTVLLDDRTRDGDPIVAVRTWRTADRKKSVKATLTKVLVKLTREDNGKEITVSADDLSEADINYLIGQLKREK